jgi:hypothetical protein
MHSVALRCSMKFLRKKIHIEPHSSNPLLASPHPDPGASRSSILRTRGPVEFLKQVNNHTSTTAMPRSPQARAGFQECAHLEAVAGVPRLLHFPAEHSGVAGVWTGSRSCPRARAWTGPAASPPPRRRGGGAPRPRGGETRRAPGSGGACGGAAPPRRGPQGTRRPRRPRAIWGWRRLACRDAGRGSATVTGGRRKRVARFDGRQRTGPLSACLAPHSPAQGLFGRWKIWVQLR